MAAITRDYLASLAPIYRDVLAAFSDFDPTRLPGEGLSFQSLHYVLHDKYAMGEIRAACEQLQTGGAVEIRNAIYAHPTPLGDALIEAITGRKQTVLPPFVPPVSVEG